MTENWEDKFWARVNKTDTCWLWMTGQNGYGYGRFRTTSRKYVPTHRISWALTYGEDSLPEFLDHTCHVRHCVNPDHLRPVTKKQNRENLSGPTPRNTSGYLGVTWHKKAGKWAAYVRHLGKTIYLGLYVDAAEAGEVCRLKRLELFTHNDTDRK